MAKPVRVNYGGIAITISVDAQKAMDALGGIPSKVIESASRRAVRDAQRAAVTTSVKLIRRRYATTTSAKDFKEDYFKKRTESSFSAAVWVESARPTLRQWNPRPVAKGVSFSILKGQGRQTWRSAFIIPGGQAQGLIGTRGKYQGNKFLPPSQAGMRRQGNSQVPITVIRTISPAGMLAKDEIITPTLERTQEVYERSLSHEIDYRLSRAIG